MRKDILERRDEITRWIEEAEPKASICRELRCKPETLNSYLDKLGIKYSGNRGLKGKKSDPKRLSALEYANTQNPKTHKLKLKLIEDGIKEQRCECCKRSDWNKEQIPLELHHIDGNKFNNNLNNLIILCPNCHAQQPGNSGANIGEYASVPERHREQA